MPWAALGDLGGGHGPVQSPPKRNWTGRGLPGKCAGPLACRAGAGLSTAGPPGAGDADSGIAGWTEPLPPHPRPEEARGTRGERKDVSWLDLDGLEEKPWLRKALESGDLRGHWWPLLPETVCSGLEGQRELRKRAK